MAHNIILAENVTFPKVPAGIGCLYFQRMKAHAKNDFLAQVDVITGEEDSFSSLLSKSIRTAQFLLNQGIGNGDMICIFGPNNLNTGVQFIASHFIGAIPSSIPTILPYDNLKDLVDTVDAKLFFVTSDKVEFVEKVLKDLGKSVEIIVVGYHESDRINFLEVLNTQVDEDNFHPMEVDDLEDTGIIFYSSGVTSRPKIICMSHYVWLLGLMYVKPTHNPDLEAAKDFESKVSGQVTVLMYKHLSWISAVLVFSKCLINGFKRVVAEIYDPREVWYTIDKYKVNLINMQVNHLAQMYQNGKPEDVDISSLFALVFAGSRASTNIILGLRKLLPTALVYQCYGQTELCGRSTSFNMMDKDHRKCIEEIPECVGFACPFITYKIIDLDTNEILGPNQPGEICIKSPMTMKGYYKMDSSQLYDKEGFFKTGDIGYYDEKKRFFIVDRINDIFKYGLLGVSPHSIEKILYTNTEVKEAVVFGIPNADKGDYVAMAVVVLQPNSRATPKEIREFVDSRVVECMKLRGGVKIVEKFPVGRNGKINTKELKAMVTKDFL